MKNVLLLLVFALVLQAARSQTKNFIDQPYLETSARVDTLVTPDRIFLEIRLQESDTKGKTSLEALERRMAASLRELDVDLEEQLTVSDLSSDFRKYFLRKQDILKEKIFELLVYDAPTAGRVLYELERIGISNVRLDRTEYSKMDTLKDTLKARAVLRARRQARIMVAAVEQSLGKALFISDSGFTVFNNMKARAGQVMMSADEPESAYVALPADFDKIRVEAGVQVKFALE
ncbi:MAG: SIMPL domain-containing protein [Robiginitalea sp.]